VITAGSGAYVVVMRPATDMRCPALIGRAAQRAAIDEVLAAAAAGRGGVVVVEGDAGVGKSRLARAATERADAAGMLVVSGRATQGAVAAFRPLAEALLSASRDGRLAATHDLAPYRAALARLVPEWADPTTLVPAEWSLVVVAEAVVRVLRAVGGERGLLLVLEDLHWADPETLEVLEYLADNVNGAPVAVVATLRPDPPAAARLAGRLAARGAAAHLTVGPLPAAQVKAMTVACLGGTVPAEVLDLVDAAEGLPLAVEDLLASAVHTGDLRWDGDGWTVNGPLRPGRSRRFADTVHDRMATLRPEAQRALRAAAVLGRSFDWRDIAPITGASPDVVLDALRAAVDRQLVIAESATGAQAFAFRHALTRDAVLDELLAPQRATLSGRAAQVVEERLVAADQAGWLLAAQLRADAGDHARAAGLLLEGGRAALAQGALQTAERLLRQGRSIAPAGPVAAQLGAALVEALALAGNGAAALDLAGDVVGLVDAWDSDRAAGVHVSLARAALGAERLADARHHLDRAGRDHSPTVAARVAVLQAHLALAAASGDRFVAAEHLAGRAVAAAHAAGLPDVECEALEIIGRCARVRDLTRAEHAFARGLDVARGAGLVLWRVRALNELGTIDMFRDVDPTRLEQARREAEHIGAVATAAGIDVNLAALYTMRHELDTALAAATRCEQVARRYRLPVRAAAVLFQAVIACHQTRFRDMRQLVATAEELAGGDPDILIGTWAMCRAMRSLLREDRTRAAQELATAADAAAASPTLAINPAAGPWLLVRAVDAQADETELARFEASNAVGTRWSTLWAGLVRAVLRGRAGDPAAASAAFDAAVSAGGPLPLFCHLGVRLACEPAVHDGWGDPASALTAAEAFFAIAGHEPVATACRSLLRHTGRSRQRRIDAGVHPQLRRLGITAREAEILALVGERLPNRDIAERLYLSPRTVEKHVASLLTKAGAASRADLVRLAGTLGLTG
jgi:DNA-binding CsgD family transcriptional regulator